MPHSMRMITSSCLVTAWLALISLTVWAWQSAARSPIVPIGMVLGISLEEGTVYYRTVGSRRLTLDV